MTVKSSDYKTTESIYYVWPSRYLLFQELKKHLSIIAYKVINFKCFGNGIKHMVNKSQKY